MNLERLTKIDLQREAVQNSAARHAGGSFEAQARIATRDARAHSMLVGILPGHAVHIASMGELSLHDVAGAIAEHYGPFDCLTLSTWAASEEAIKRILALRQSGLVRRLEALVDSRMPTDCADAHVLMSNKPHGFDLYHAGQNHSKVMAFTGGPKMYAPNFDEDGVAVAPDLCLGAGGVSVVSTANLTRNPRCEALVVTNDATLAAFHRDWIRAAIREAAHA